MANQWLKQLRKKEGAVIPGEYFPFDFVLQSGSPYLDYIYANSHGLPFGYSEIIFGPPKCGKSILCNMKAGALHRSDPEAIVVKFNTEMREEGQMSPYWGIDHDRYQAYNVNKPGEVFDYIEHEIAEMCEAGAPIKYIIIDSMQGIQGRRGQNAGSIDDFQPGDHAITIQEGMKRIIPTIRKYKIALTCTAHIRANFDGGFHAAKTKMAGAWGLQHTCEYFISVNRDRSSDGKKDLLKQELADSTMKDVKGAKDLTGHKIFVKMEDSSVGVAKRVGEFTLSYKEGLINTHEEVFLMARGMNIITLRGNRYYTYGETEYNSKGDILKAIQEIPELYKQIIDESILLDMAHHKTS